MWSQFIDGCVGCGPDLEMDGAGYGPDLEMGDVQLHG